MVSVSTNWTISIMDFIQGQGIVRKPYSNSSTQGLLHKDNCNETAKKLGTNHCILVAMVPLSKDSLMSRHFPWEQMSSLQREITIEGRQLTLLVISAWVSSGKDSLAFKRASLLKKLNGVLLGLGACGSLGFSGCICAHRQTLWDLANNSSQSFWLRLSRLSEQHEATIFTNTKKKKLWKQRKWEDEDNYDNDDGNHNICMKQN